MEEIDGDGEVEVRGESVLGIERETVVVDEELCDPEAEGQREVVDKRVRVVETEGEGEGETEKEEEREIEGEFEEVCEADCVEHQVKLFEEVKHTVELPDAPPRMLALPEKEELGHREAEDDTEAVRETEGVLEEEGGGERVLLREGVRDIDTVTDGDREVLIEYVEVRHTVDVGEGLKDGEIDRVTEGEREGDLDTVTDFV